LLQLDCHVLIPAAMENQITAANAGNIRTRIVAEGANGPTTPEAEAILHDMRTLVIPDVLSNVGGVTVSYFEWLQGREQNYWTVDEVNTRMECMLELATREVWCTREREHCDLRTAAYVLGIGRVAEAIKARGLYP
jgi:glutamate dehydrogenase/leucine dehydrogenase